MSNAPAFGLFSRNKHIMIDLGTGNNNKINWPMEDKQEMIDIVETVYRGARKGRGLVVSPKDYSTKYRYWFSLSLFKPFFTLFVYFCFVDDKQKKLCFSSKGGRYSSYWSHCFLISFIQFWSLFEFLWIKVSTILRLIIKINLTFM